MPDVHAGCVPSDCTRPAKAPYPLGAHVVCFGAFGLIGHMTRHTLRDVVPAMARFLRPDVPSLRPGRG